MNTIARGALHMMATTGAFLGFLVADRLAYVAIHAEDPQPALLTGRAPGLLVPGNLADLWLVAACSIAIYVAGTGVLHTPDEAVPEGPIPLVLGLLSLLPLAIFSLAVAMLRS